MYGDKPSKSVRQFFKELLCYHRPVKTNYYDYTCTKCGMASDKEYTGFKIQHLFWWLTQRLPLDDETTAVDLINEENASKAKLYDEYMKSHDKFMNFMAGLGAPGYEKKD